MSLDGRSRQALSVVLHHDRDALVSRQREEIERLKTMMKNRYLRAAMNLIDAKKEHDANLGPSETRHVEFVNIYKETIGSYYSDYGDQPENFHIPVSEKRAMITGLCALGYHVVDMSQTYAHMHGDVSLKVCWWPTPGFPNLDAANMEAVLEGLTRGAQDAGALPLPVLHLASPNPL
mmetsp:Transcript_20472/g.66233  ORF Transcript_20472/g.66233 Transcript_20472/m.66233 type:complete len:177 (+) Transcript_20472:185-715(+)